MQNKNIVNVTSNLWAVSGQKLIVGINRAKHDLAAQYADQSELPLRLFQVALNEAEALAWETEYPQLVFPTLAEEKIAAVSSWYERGGSLRSDYAIAV